MGAIGTPITPSIPPVGSTGPGYATDINAILGELVARLSAKVPLSSVDFGSDLNMAGSRILNAGAITVSGELVSPISSPSNRITTFLGDLWYVSPSGAIKLTAGAALNAAAVGGITGDYGGANPAQFRFDDANLRYDAYDNFGTGAWADVRARAFDVAAGATSAVFARLMFGGVANKTYTLPPAAATATDRPMYMDSAGQIKLGFGTIPFHYSSFGATPINDLGVFNTTAFVFADSPQGGIVLNGASTIHSCYKGIDAVPEGLSMTSVTFHLTKASVTNTRLEVIKRAPGGVSTSLGVLNTTTNGAQNAVLTFGSPEIVAANTSYVVRWLPNGGSNSGEIWHGFTVNATMAP